MCAPTETISETTPRVIEEGRARKLSMEMKHCTYYETCATNGFRVDEVFSEGRLAVLSLLIEKTNSSPCNCFPSAACRKIVQMRNSENTLTALGGNSRPSTPNHTGVYRSMANNVTSATPLSGSTSTNAHSNTPLGNITNSSKFRNFKSSPITTVSSSCTFAATPEQPLSQVDVDVAELRPSRTSKGEKQPASPIRSAIVAILTSNATTPVNSKPTIAAKPKFSGQTGAVSGGQSTQVPISTSPVPVAPKRSESIKLSNENQFKVPPQLTEKELPKEQITPAQTPNIVRKNRRKSNLFTPLSGKSKSYEDKYKNGEVGVGRAIPVRCSFYSCANAFSF